MGSIGSAVELQNGSQDFHFFNCPCCRIFILCEFQCSNATFFGYIISVLASVQTEEMNIFYDIFRRDMKGEPISSGYLSDHETKLQDMVQQLSVESQDSRFCYLTSSEVSFTIGNLITYAVVNKFKRNFELSFVC